jgi:hypothetical protein
MGDDAPGAVRVIKRGTGRALPLVEGPGSAMALVWPGMGARHRSLHHFDLEPGSGTVVQQHEGEAVYGVLVGAASIIDVTTDAAADLPTGAMVHLDARTRYRFVAGADGAVIVGGPCPPDDRLYV